MNIRLAAKMDLTKATYLPFEASATNRNPRSLAEIAEIKDQVVLSDQLNTNLQRYEDIIGALSELDQKSSDLNRNRGEVAVSGAKIPGYTRSFDAYFQFLPSHTGQEQPVVSAELAEDGETVFAFRQEGQGAEAKLTATVLDRISGQEYQIAGSLNGVAKVTGKQDKMSVAGPGIDWLGGSRGTTPP